MCRNSSEVACHAHKTATTTADALSPDDRGGDGGLTAVSLNNDRSSRWAQKKSSATPSSGSTTAAAVLPSAPSSLEGDRCKARLCLLAASALYASEFCFVKSLNATGMPVGISLVLRFGIASLVSLPMFLFAGSKWDRAGDRNGDDCGRGGCDDEDVERGTSLFGRDVADSYRRCDDGDGVNVYEEEEERRMQTAPLSGNFRSSSSLTRKTRGGASTTRVSTLSLLLTGLEVGLYNGVGFATDAIILNGRIAAVGELSLFGSLATVFVPFLDRFVLGKRLRSEQLAGVALAMIGIVLLEWPFGDEEATPTAVDWEEFADSDIGVGSRRSLLPLVRSITQEGRGYDTDAFGDDYGSGGEVYDDDGGDDRRDSNAAAAALFASSIIGGGRSLVVGLASSVSEAATAASAAGDGDYRGGTGYETDDGGDVVMGRGRDWRMTPPPDDVDVDYYAIGAEEMTGQEGAHATTTMWSAFSAYLVANKGNKIICIIPPIMYGLSFWRMEHAVERFPGEAKRLTAAQTFGVFFVCALYYLTTPHQSSFDGGGGISDAIPVTTQQIIEWLSTPDIFFQLVWSGVAAIVVTSYLEMMAMRTLTASESVVIYSTEPVFASAFAAMFVAGESFLGGTAMGAYGATFVLSGCAVSELGLGCCPLILGGLGGGGGSFCLRWLRRLRLSRSNIRGGKPIGIGKSVESKGWTRMTRAWDGFGFSMTTLWCLCFVRRDTHKDDVGCKKSLNEGHSRTLLFRLPTWQRLRRRRWMNPGEKKDTERNLRTD